MFPKFYCVIIALALSPIRLSSQVAVFGPETYTRAKGQPVVVTKTFSVQDLTGPFTLVVQNGDGKRDRSSSAVVSLNQVVIVGPRDFNKQVGLIKTPVQLQSTNIISVEMRSRPGSFVVVTVMGPSERPTVELPVASPESVFVGTSTVVTVTSKVSFGINGPPVVANGVVLVQVDEANRVVAILGTMLDDGTSGDLVADDQIFTLRFTVNPTGVGEIRLRVSALFQGLPLPVLSDVRTLPVLPQPSWTQTVGPEGGKLEYPNGVVLDIPAGALNQKVAIEVRDVSVDQANAILAVRSAISTHRKRFLGGFEVVGHVEFNVPIKVDFPVTPLTCQEIPVPVELDLAQQTYKITTEKLTYRGSEGLAELEATHLSPKGAAAAEQDPPKGCGENENPQDCARRMQQCESCETNTPETCGSFVSPLLPACCLLRPADRSSCTRLVPPGSNCECCTEKRIEVISQDGDKELSYGCRITSKLVKVSFLDCPDRPTFYDFIVEASDSCEMKLEFDPSPLGLHVCEQKSITEKVVATDKNDPNKTPMDFSSADASWTIDNKEVAILATSVGTTVEVRALNPSPLPASATIGARILDLHLQGSVPTTVNDTQVKITPESIKIPVGEKIFPIVSIDGICGTVTAPCKMTWSADNAGVVQLDQIAGGITGLKPGTAIVTAVLDKAAMGLTWCQGRDFQGTTYVTVSEGFNGCWTGVFRAVDRCPLCDPPILIDGDVREPYVSASILQSATTFTATVVYTGDGDVPVMVTKTGTVNGSQISLTDVSDVSAELLSIGGTFSADWLGMSGTGVGVGWQGSAVLSSDGQQITGSASGPQGTATWTLQRIQCSSGNN